MLDERPVRVSVLMITWNHQKYIAQAIESVLMQSTPFRFELIIGEDKSTDLTRDILLDYKRRYPEIIRVLLPDDNQGANRNFINTLQACTGRYIAVLEGDDYWTSSDKLRIQAAVLDEHPDVAICCHPVNIVRNDETVDPATCPTLPPGRYGLVDLVRDNFIPTCSTMFRRNPALHIPEWFVTLPVGDWPWQIFNASTGDIILLDCVLARYRVHNGGSWSVRPAWEKAEAIVQLAERLDEFLQYRYHRSFVDIQNRWYRIACQELLKVKDFTAARAFARRVWATAPLSLDCREKTGLLLRAYLPRLYAIAAQARQI